MCRRGIFFLPTLLCLLLWGCAGPEEGLYSGSIGQKKEVTVRVDKSGEISLDGYWQQTLRGRHERGSLKGEDLDALVFEGPKEKNFKLRILYEEDSSGLIIRAIQSRTYGPGARYVPTEKDGVFDPPPHLDRVGGQE